MILRHELTAAIALIERLEDTSPLSDLDLFHYKRRRVFRRARMDEDHEDYLAAYHLHRVKWPIKSPRLLRDKNHPVYGDTNYALGLHVQCADGFLDDWFTVGAAHPLQLGRIPLLLKRAKRQDLVDRLETAHARHFGNFWKSPINRPPSGDGIQDILQSRVERLEVRLRERGENDAGQSTYEFDFHCLDCGGTVLDFPENDEGPVICVACRQVFGEFGDMKKLCMHIGSNPRPD